MVLRPPVNQLSSEKLSIQYTSLLAMFILLHSSTSQQLLKKHLSNVNNHYENTDDFIYKKGSHHVQPPIDTFRCQQR